MNTIIFLLVALSLLSVTTLTSYALFTNDIEGRSSINITVQTAGRISVRILTQSNGTEVGTLQNHQNIIKFNVKDGYVMSSFSCTTGEASYNKVTNVLTINNATKNGTCEINYVEGYGTLYDKLLSEQPLVKDNGLLVSYQTDDGKPVYYYRGNANNYVYFADRTWRVMRINNDKTIRIMAVSGISSSGNIFNSDGTNNYKNLYYSETGTIVSGAKKTLDDWYTNNLQKYDSYLTTGRFCEAAKLTFKSNSGSTLTAGNQVMTPIPDDYEPTLKCKRDANGKGPLDLKIGLISLDEAIMIGLPLYTGTQVSNKDTFLEGVYSYTMTPAGINAYYSHVWYIGDGSFYFVPVSNTSQLLPVITLKADVKAKNGKGTSDAPYTLVTN